MYGSETRQKQHLQESPRCSTRFGWFLDPWGSSVSSEPIDLWSRGPNGFPGFVLGVSISSLTGGLQKVFHSFLSFLSKSKFDDWHSKTFQNILKKGHITSKRLLLFAMFEGTLQVQQYIKGYYRWVSYAVWVQWLDFSFFWWCHVDSASFMVAWTVLRRSLLLNSLNSLLPLLEGFTCFFCSILSMNGL